MALNITIDPPKGMDLSEKGRSADGQPLALDRRLFMQLLAFGGCTDIAGLIDALKDAGIDGVLYADLRDPSGVALLTYSEEPNFFIETLRPFLHAGPFAALKPKPAYTMLGRTYTIGYEQDLEDVLIRRPIRHASNPEWPWAIWYPLRRSGAFALLSASEQRKILMEHGGIGASYGRADHAHDIRLACHGLDRDDNDFVVALIGKALAPLSKVVEHMRKTEQTAQFMDQLGPFFIGRAVWQQPGYESP